MDADDGTRLDLGRQQHPSGFVWSGTVGQLLGTYQVEGLLGHGGKAEVYMARQPGLDRLVALKVLRSELAADPEFVRRFQDEARIQARLSHPHVVPIYDIGAAHGTYYIAMRYVAGGTLADVVRSAGALPLPRVVALLRQVADALDFAHSHGVTHRDLKPSNVLVEGNDYVSLGDFGIAFAADATTRLTRAGAVAETATYMAPEQAQGLASDYRVDLYALGIVAYELLAGQVPFRADSEVAILHQQVYDPPPPIRRTRPDLPERVEQALGVMLAKQPDDRFVSAAAFLNALAGSQLADLGGGRPGVPPGQAPTAVRPPTVPTPPTATNGAFRGAASDARRSVVVGGRRRLPFVLGGLAVVLVLAAAAAVWATTSRGPLTQLAIQPTTQPAIAAAQPPTLAPTLAPTPLPTLAPVVRPTAVPTLVPTVPPTLAPSPTPQPSPTPLPAVAPDLVSYTLSPQQTQPGGAITMSYDISNGGTSPASAVLGASIRRNTDSAWINDPADDTPVTVLPGRAIFTRVFRVPQGLPDGTYNVAWGLFGNNGEGYAMKEEASVLQIASPVAAPVVAAPAPPAAVADPAGAVRDFYTSIGAHDLQTAFSLLSPRLRGTFEFQKWAQGFQNTHDVEVPVARTLSRNGSNATVSFTLNSADGDTAQVFQGTWQLVLVDGGWKLDKPNIKQLQ